LLFNDIDRSEIGRIVFECTAVFNKNAEGKVARLTHSSGKLHREQTMSVQNAALFIDQLARDLKARAAGVHDDDTASRKIDCDPDFTLDELAQALREWPADLLPDDLWRTSGERVYS
jgi:hypothetical protein